MTVSKKYLFNTLLIGLSFVLLKSFNLALPYFLSDVSYNEFNKVFYYASLVTTIGTLGFTYAITQINFTPLILIVMVSLNIIISFFIVQLLSGITISALNLIIIFIISFTSIIFSIYNFRLLFFSKTKEYFLTILIISTFYFASLAASILLNTDLILSYGLFGVVGLIFSFRYFDIGKNKRTKDIKRFYKLGLATFIINSAAGMILMADKFFANNFFSVDVANAYTFSWAIVAPIFYIGNIAEKNIYAAESKVNVKNALLNSFGLIALGLLFYASIIFIVTNYFPNILPRSINIELFTDIILYMFIGHSLFIFFHFPVNGILFKMNFHDSQKITSYSYLAIMSVLLGLYYFDLIKIGNDNYLLLLILVVVTLLILSISKFLLLTFLHKKAIYDFVRK